MLASPVLSAKPIERRRHQRVPVSLPGRYMLGDRREFPCQTIDMSPGGLAVYAPVQGARGERVVAYLEQFGRIEGIIARHFDHGFALAMTVPLMKREKLADQLTWLANRHALGMKEDRRHERIAPRDTRTTLRAIDGREWPARLIDISRSGAAMTVDANVPMGTGVVVGTTGGRVVRVFAGGIAVEFSRLLAEETFGPETRI